MGRIDSIRLGHFGPARDQTRPVMAGLVWFILALSLVCGCAVPRSRAVLPPPGPEADRLVGLALSERISLDVKSKAMVGLVPSPDSSSLYTGVVRPGEIEVTFRRQGAGGLYLSWVKAGLLQHGSDEVTIVLTSHEIRGRAGSFTTTWPADRSPVITGRFRAGQVTYLGVVERRIFMPRPVQTGTEARPRVRVELSVAPDPEGRAILGLCSDHPWLKERLLNPPK